VARICIFSGKRRRNKREANLVPVSLGFFLFFCDCRVKRVGASQTANELVFSGQTQQAIDEAAQLGQICARLSH
jgi:hypothetical protein